MNSTKNPPEMVTQHGSLHAPEIPDPAPEVAEAVQGADVVVTPTKHATGKSTKILDEMEALPTSPRANKTAADYFKSPSALGEGETSVRVCPDCGERYFMGHNCPKTKA